MSIYTIDVERYNEIMALTSRFDEAEECLNQAQRRLAECEETVTQGYKAVEDIREVLFDTPIADRHEETETDKLVKLTGKSISELKSILSPSTRF